MSALVLLSGGMDSATVLGHAIETRRSKPDSRVEAISFDYGQRHRVELYAARRIAEHYQIDHDIVDLSGLGPLLTGSALTDPSILPPEGHYAEANMAVTVVPNRNTIMLSIAVGVAISRGIEYVLAAMHAGDHPVYPDCRPEFISKLNELIPIATESEVMVFAPFINMTKAEIARRGSDLGVPYALTWSCYRGGDQHCGRCSTCVERAEAFNLAGVDDPTDYEDSSFWAEAIASYQGG
jgi:7-cyano-7-deazaguanine synthase